MLHKNHKMHHVFTLEHIAGMNDHLRSSVHIFGGHKGGIVQGCTSVRVLVE